MSVGNAEVIEHRSTEGLGYQSMGGDGGRTGAGEGDGVERELVHSDGRGVACCWRRGAGLA